MILLDSLRTTTTNLLGCTKWHFINKLNTLLRAAVAEITSLVVSIKK
jgi:hypothetical protein